jgi:hypothetical protein
MQRVMAKCAERCGWTGEVRTGWIDCDEGAARAGGIPEDRLRWRGAQMQHRRRLRDARCPGCGLRGLDRCERIGPAIQPAAPAR